MSEKFKANYYRADLPPVPERLLHRPVLRGYPVPWFVAETDGVYDFRVADPRKLVRAVKGNLCWTCGERLGSTLCFVLGPMCAINRISSESPSHRECAEFSVKACPFLTQRQAHRRTNDLPATIQTSAGIAIERQPGVALLWLTNGYQPFDAGNGVLFRVGEPHTLFWYREGRIATRAEIIESIESGLPILRDAARLEGSVSEREIEEQIRRGLRLVPTDDAPLKLKLGSAAKRCPL